MTQLDLNKITENVLDVQDLSVEFRNARQTTQAVKNISFHIRKGETVALVGESGSGKSVSALSILKLLPYPSAHHPSGKVLFQGKDILQNSEEQMRTLRGNAITMIFQEPMTSLNPLHTIRQQISEIILTHHPLSRKEADDRTLLLLNQVGIRNAEERLSAYPHQLSGGQRQRVMIAMALANEPDLLIADEPTTALDVTVQAQILELLNEIKTRKGMSMLFITHDLGIVRKIADRVCVMWKGEIVEEGSVKDVFKHPQHAYTKTLLEAEPKGKANTLEAHAPTILKAESVNVRFPVHSPILRRVIDHVTAIKNISLSIKAGETIGIVGESGSGKTTLGLALLKLIKSEGNIFVNGTAIQDLSNKEMRHLRKDLQIVFQDPYGSLSPRLSVADIVAEGLLVQNPDLSWEEQRHIVSESLIEVGLEPEVMDRYPHEFSGGQRQRIAIARAFALKPKLIIFDEPTSALDMSVQAQIVEMLRTSQKASQTAYLFISHDLKVVRAMSNYILVMRNGEVVEEGVTETIFKNPRTDYTKTLFSAAFDLRI